MKVRWLLWVLLTGLCGSRGAAADSYPLQAGEDLLFAIKWGVIKAGYSTLTIPRMVTLDGQPAMHIVSEARSCGLVDTFYRVRDKNESWLDAHAQSTYKYSKQIREGGYKVDEQVTFDRAAGRFRTTSYRIDKNRHEDAEGVVPLNVLDIFGSLYHVRTLPLEVGKEFTLDVHSGEKVYPLVVSVKRRETVKVKAGKYDCFVVEPHLRSPGIFVQKGKKLEVWLTADARHMPVLMRSEVFIGHVSAELIKNRTASPAVAMNLPATDEIDQ